MKSQLYLSEGVENTERKFGEWKGTYYPALVHREDGNEMVAFFTADQIQVAIDRASRNPEDVPENPEYTVWERLFGGDE